jgi:hypothetical protein
MRHLRPFSSRLFSFLVCLYPASFRREYGPEILSVFSEAVSEPRGLLWPMILCLRECWDLPAALLREYREQVFGSSGGQMNTDAVLTPPASRWEALLGALPFLAYGLASMLGKLTFDRFQPGMFIWLGLYAFILLGLLVGWVKGFPRWSYAYPGWALILSWLLSWYWTNTAGTGLHLFGFTLRGQLLCWPAWLPLGLVSLLALLRTRFLRPRSLCPLKQFFLGIWNDWTLLSLLLYTLPAWALLLYDENHHPYLFAFMLASTLVLGLGAWFHLRSAGSLGRLLSLLAATLTGLVIAWVCDGTWDFAAYYHLPPSTDPWYVTLLRWSMSISLAAALLFGPALLALLRRKLKT